MRDPSHDLDPVGVGRLHGEPGGDDGDVAVYRAPDGSTVMAPVSYRRLDPAGRDAVAAVQQAASQIAQWQALLAESVSLARDEGVSWDLLGWSVGTTGSAARKRWGVDADGA